MFNTLFLRLFYFILLIIACHFLLINLSFFPFFSFSIVYCSVFYSVPDPDLEIRRGGEQGGKGQRSSGPLEKRGARSLKIFFSALRALVWCKNKEGKGRGSRAPGSATVISAGTLN